MPLNPSLERGREISVSSKPDCTTEKVSGQRRLHSETLSREKKQTSNKITKQKNLSKPLTTLPGLSTAQSTAQWSGSPIFQQAVSTAAPVCPQPLKFSQLAPRGLLFDWPAPWRPCLCQGLPTYLLYFTVACSLWVQSTRIVSVTRKHLNLLNGDKTAA